MDSRNEAVDGQRLDVAKRAARAAGELVLGFSADLEVEFKTPKDLVTAADVAAQELIVGMIVEAFPDDKIVAEEGLLDVPEAGYWVGDPLDGTVNYSRGLPLFGVSIAYMDGNGQLRVGAMHLPVFDELYWASAGGGAFLNGQKIRVSHTEDLNRALVNVSD